MKPLASISLDMDNQWSYMKTHGDQDWQKYPSYLDILVPYTLELLDDLDLKITFFIVGQDSVLDKNKEFLRLLPQNGHEIANHSFSHEPWLHLYSKDQISEEIEKTDSSITSVVGEKPIGFRGPGFSWSEDLLEVLAENNYKYDASSLPTFIGPLARAYYFWTSNFTKEEKEQRKGLFGNFKDGFRPNKPYFWKLKSGKQILEIPVTTIPVFKIPFHLSYLLYLSRFSEKLMILYLKMAITICRVTGTRPSILLHPLDLLGGDQLTDLKFFPGMDVNGKEKREIFKKVLKEFKQYFNLVNMSNFADYTEKEGNIKYRNI